MSKCRTIFEDDKETVKISTGLCAGLTLGNITTGFMLGCSNISPMAKLFGVIISAVNTLMFGISTGLLVKIAKSDSEEIVFK